MLSKKERKKDTATYTHLSYVRTRNVSFDFISDLWSRVLKGKRKTQNWGKNSSSGSERRIEQKSYRVSCISFIYIRTERVYCWFPESSVSNAGECNKFASYATGLTAKQASNGNSVFLKHLPVLLYFFDWPLWMKLRFEHPIHGRTYVHGEFAFRIYFNLFRHFKFYLNCGEHTHTHTYG